MAISTKIANGLSWIESRFSDNSAILLYHRVDEGCVDPFRLCVSPENFEQHMETLAEAGTALSLPDFVARQRAGELNPGSVCVTFDDGYLDVFTNGLPILQRYQIPATIFLVAGQLGVPFWWDRIANLIFAADCLPETVQLPTPQGEPLDVVTAKVSRSQLMKCSYAAFSQLAPADRPGRVDIFAASFQQAEPGAQSPSRTVKPDELLQVARDPLLTIGAHTVTHSRLADMSYADQFAEINSSIEFLSETVGFPIRTFSYPFGLKGRDYTDETIEAVRSTGLDHALAADRNTVTAHSDPFALPRLWIHNRNGSQFQRQLKRWLGAGALNAG
jgi:peptidoglycan/xylan/chitin deacetylase (PgdA/CDA1 family)